MPKIICPRCELTINLENRREMDAHMITSSVKREAKTFTQLLHITGLPRKTLNLRLNKLCQDGVLTKANGVYQLNGHSGLNQSFASSFSRVFHDGKIKGAVILLVLLMGYPAFSYALAALSPTVTYIPKGQEILGTFTVVVEVSDVKDIWAWQVLINFNSSELKYLEWRCGEVIQTEDPFKCTSPEPDIRRGLLLIGATLKGDDPGVDIEGSGNLAFVVFGYYVENYSLPQLIMEHTNTILLNSKLQAIPMTDTTLSIKVLT